MFQDTLLVVTADHGEGLGAHPEIGHVISTWEEQLAVPLLLRFPDGRKPKVHRTPTSLVALAPTVLDALEIRRPPTPRGRPTFDTVGATMVTADYRSYFTGPSAAEPITDHGKRYPELRNRVVHTHVVYCDGYKLSMLNRSKGTRFFDLRLDPEEAHNLVDSAADTETLRALQHCISHYKLLKGEGRFTPFEATPWPIKQGGPKNATIEQLRSLGYIE